MTPALFKAAIIQVVAGVGSIAVAFGAFSQTKEQLLIAAAGQVAGGVINVVVAIEGHTDAVKKLTAAVHGRSGR